jgi:hypothetical protein
MKIARRGGTDVYRRAKVVEREVSLDEGFYTFYHRSVREEPHR